MSILNYFFIGTAFTFIVDLLLNTKYIKTHPNKTISTWGFLERTICIIIWPLAVLVFLFSFLKTIFRN
jgi:hypothetical protein